MSFAWPQLLWLLLCPAALLAWDLSHRRRTAVVARPKILRADAGARSLKLSSFEAGQAPSRVRPRWWFCFGLALCVAALARPQWGRIDEPVFEQSREILLAIDLSRSMLAPDVRPSRLERAKLLIRSLLEKLAGERVGLVVFSGTAFLQAPLSADYEILLEFLPALGPGFLPEGGSNYRAMLDASLGAFVGTAGADRYLIVLSDGEATDDEWKARAAQLKAKGIRVIGLGVGTAAGSMVPDEAGGFIKDERGAVVLTKLESGTLQELAQATGGVYRDASTWVDLAALLQETIESGRKGQFVETNTIRLVERFQWPLALGLWFLLVSFYYEFPVRPRTRDIALRAGGKGQGAKGKASEKAVPDVITASLMVLFAVCPLLFAAAAIAADMTTEAPPPPPLAKIVGRLSSAATQTGRDWAELATETVSWGSRFQSEQQAVPEGPVRDALSAVDLGAKLDPKTADWPKLREELENLLKKPEEQKQDQEKQDQQKQDQQKQDQKQDQQKQDDQQKSDEQKNQPQDQKDAQQKPQEQKGESAFGDMNQKDQPPPPPPNDTQKVGGTEKKEEQEPVDPSLALPLQKLDQLRNQDSPAQLFRLMEGDKKAPKKAAKDW